MTVVIDCNRKTAKLVWLLNLNFYLSYMYGIIMPGTSCQKNNNALHSESAGDTNGDTIEV